MVVIFSESPQDVFLIAQAYGFHLGFPYLCSGSAPFCDYSDV